MIQFKSDQGEISISSAVFSNITGMAATNCFGVKGMAFRNLPAVCRSIMNEVRYVVTKNTGVPVKAVDVCVDSMTL